MRRRFVVGNYVHVFNRGNRQLPIVYDDADKWRFLKILRYFNDEYSPQNIFRELETLINSGGCDHFEWPKFWPPHKSLVKILSYCLVPNHFHLLLKEIIKGGISKFMRKLGDGFTKYINIKYEQVGRIFQSPYKEKIIIGDPKNLHYLDAYIQVFNVFELYPGGIQIALREFNKAFEFALNYPFSSLGESFGIRKLNIIERDVLKETFPNLKVYKEFVYDALLVRNIREILDKLTIE